MKQVFALLLLLCCGFAFSQTAYRVIDNDSLKYLKTKVVNPLNTVLRLDTRILIYNNMTKNGTLDSLVEVDAGDIKRHYPFALVSQNKDTFMIDYALLVPALVGSTRQLNGQINDLEDAIIKLSETITNQNVQFTNTLNELKYKNDQLNMELESFRKSNTTKH